MSIKCLIKCMKKYEIAIIGAGPAGIMAAITAARVCNSVVLIEKNDQIGRKLLATGNGRCNLTNKNITVDRYHGSNPHFIEKILKSFDQSETTDFFESLGVALKEEDKGRIFPRTNQASTILDALTHELERLNVKIEVNYAVAQISKNDSWQIQGPNGDIISADKLILTTGGKAAHYLGSSGDGIFWSGKLGHSIKTSYAALVPIETIETWPKEIQGLKIEGAVRIVSDGQIIAEKKGDIMFTHYGLSGPAIMGLSREVSPLLQKSKVEIVIDTVTDIDVKDLNEKIKHIFEISGVKTIKNALAGFVPANLVIRILKNLKIDLNKKSAQISKQERKAIIDQLKNLTLTVSKSRPLKEAQVSTGGVDSDEINPKTMESTKLSNLYFAGEIIDVDADSGGFNLQWAWSSGFVAGKSAASK